MRVIGGSARSLRLQCPKHLRIRPTADMIRETIFNILGPRIVGAVFCDLYAGCGSVGIEALSRGARRCLFIESRDACVHTIEANLQHTGLASGAVVLAGRLPAAYAGAAQAHGPFDLVFADPPYEDQTLAQLVQRLVVEGEGLAPEALVIIQRSRHNRPAQLPQADRVKRFGETVVEFFPVRGGGTASDD